MNKGAVSQPAVPPANLMQPVCPPCLGCPEPGCTCECAGGGAAQVPSPHFSPSTNHRPQPTCPEHNTALSSPAQRHAAQVERTRAGAAQAARPLSQQAYPMEAGVYEVGISPRAQLCGGTEVCVWSAFGARLERVWGKR